MKAYTVRPLSLISIILLLSACSGESDTPAPQVADFPRLVKTTVLGEADRDDALTLPGRVEATDRAELAFPVEGPLIELPIVEGQFVEKGRLLARIDPRDYENRVAEAEARLNEAKRKYQRYAQLIKSKVSPVSKAELDQAKSQFEIAEANLEQAQKNLQDTFLYAPFDGVVAVRYVDNYQNVQAKEPIVQFEDASHLDIIVDVPERFVARAKRGLIGKEVGKVIVEAQPGRSFPVKLKEFSTRADPNTQTYKATLVMPRPDDLNVLPGMTATFVNSPSQIGEASRFIVPATAITGGNEGPAYAWVVNMEPMTVSKRAIKLGQKTGDSVQVLEGLKTGDRIVVAGVDLLKEGMQVRLYEVGMLGG